MSSQLAPASAAPGRNEPSPARLRVPGRLWLLILAGCVTAGFLDALQMALKGLLGPEGRIDWAYVVFQGSEWLFLAGLTLLTFFLGQRFPVRRPRPGRALLVHATGALVLCIAWAVLGVVLRRGLGRAWAESFAEELTDWVLTSVPWSFFMYFAVLGTVHAFAYYVEARDRELVATQLTGQLTDARLRALRAQLQPHFLFNTLNAITVLVRDRRGTQAVRMLERLSGLLRVLLRADQPHEIPLRSELQLVQQYLDIEQVRFSDRLRIEITVADEALDCEVPALMLQPLVENALRYGLAARVADTIIEIGARREGGELELWVRDHGRGVAQTGRQGIGLENTRDRLATLYGDAATLTLSDHPAGGAIARVRLPCRTRTG